MRGAVGVAGDVAGVAAGLWVLLGSPFDGVAAEGLLNTAAIFVLVVSAWRLVRRLRGARR